MGQCLNIFLLLIPLKMESQNLPINFLSIINDDVTGTIQLARYMPNFTFMGLQLLRNKW